MPADPRKKIKVYLRAEYSLHSLRAEGYMLEHSSAIAYNNEKDMVAANKPLTTMPLKTKISLKPAKTWLAV